MPFNLLGNARASPVVADAVGWNLSEAPENRRTRRPKDRTVTATASNVRGGSASTFSLRAVAHANCPLGVHGAGLIASACSARALRGVNDRRDRSLSTTIRERTRPSPSASKLGIPILRRGTTKGHEIFMGVLHAPCASLGLEHVLSRRSTAATSPTRSSMISANTGKPAQLSASAGRRFQRYHHPRSPEVPIACRWNSKFAAALCITLWKTAPIMTQFATQAHEIASFLVPLVA
jgi:hypothetical protein